MESYDQLLKEAYSNIKVPEKVCDRFEIKKVTGHQEGNRTIIDNFMQIASCLSRDPYFLTKFLFRELATFGDMEGDRLILNRKISSARINEKIEAFVNKYVICAKCKKPDTEIIEEGDKTFIRCMACTHKERIK